MKGNLRKYLMLISIAIFTIRGTVTISEYLSAETSSTYEKIYADKIHERHNQEKIIDDFVRTSDMSPGSSIRFYYPDSQNIHNRDAFQAFNLIRLPEYLGGATNDVSSFRAYSGLDLTSHCITKYWPLTGRDFKIEDPCISPGYRVLDGVSVHPHVKLTRGSNAGALPQLDLSIDEDGFLLVESPVLTRDENGIIGVGRDVSDEEILAVSQILLSIHTADFPDSAIVPLTLDGGYYLHFVNPGNGNHPTFEYYHPTSRLDMISMPSDCKQLLRP